MRILANENIPGDAVAALRARGHDVLTLKDYQQRALDSLSAYFADCARTGDADTAFYEATRREFRTGIAFQPVRELPGLPYVCLRIPTGGGKTLMACHAVSIAARDLLHADYPVVLWLVPSNAIREQTLKALRDRHHPYRQALEATCGSIEVLDVGEALYVTRATLDAQTTIIVATMQAFRVEDTVGRKVYEHNGTGLMSHFSGLLPEQEPGLQRGEGGYKLFSLANVLHLRRPVVIVDEAHNARTGLSFETLARFNPSCILEFTATPDRERNPSNILHSVSAAELKAEHMIKMPIRLVTRLNWKELLSDAVSCREKLERAANMERQATGEYIRPIVLIQAEAHSKERPTITVETIRECLLEDHRIPDEQVAIATGAKNELDGVDVLSAECPIRFIITMQALREGWDCPFAYVLCSVADLRSSTYVEQILGRVMRLPRAAEKTREELNVAYAYASSSYWQTVANALTDALVKVYGFEKQDAKDLIVPPSEYETGSLIEEFMGTYTEVLIEAPKSDPLPSCLEGKVSFDSVPTSKGESVNRVMYQGSMSAEERELLKTCVNSDADKAAIDRLFQRINHPSQVGEGGRKTREPFSIPILAIRQGTIFEQLEETHFLDRPWDLARCDATLSGQEYSTEAPQPQTGDIDVSEDGVVKARFIANLHDQMALLVSEDRWSAGQLVRWLDSHIPHLDITQTESGVFLTRAVQGLLDRRGISLSVLVHDKYRLRTALDAKIDGYRQSARQTAFQALLLPECETPLVVTHEKCFSFDPTQYPFSRRYKGSYVFRKHFYEDVGDLNSEGEEFECAQFLDKLEEVETWVRNLERRPHQSFWLQTATDRFYPDFVCKLKDGRFLVVEYKGAYLAETPDSREKRALGELWEERSNGTCLFVMQTGKNFAAIEAKITAGKPKRKGRGGYSTADLIEKD
ncbi:MAG: DEAD/DEAH box helicase family protein [Candidatus Hydrogenedentes bacterium]|nr:DEAD/DEAH box helicase family protein [Candidatus Hydrogenedentota bacterium]